MTPPAHHACPVAGDIVVPNLLRRPGRRFPLPAWWQPGVYGSVPAVALWIAARLPAQWLWSLAGQPDAAEWLNQAGDTVFVAGWAGSALMLWLGRHRPAPAARSEAADESNAGGVGGAGGAGAQRTPRRHPAS
ncbi:hypothetical protein [Cupriavidus oxalaticus]|jgi:hypothetical protein|uniref:Uncharacterized protein n=1 Tax=Cupriavidus oxalaticus TaxID=96344 RepID=A0A976B8E8_9BURK|nr:hypothetical protein [Cupriavidus oxalaticus]WQD82752.1 hypothetical protein U0036_17030 [Cupriavidus oxalaticus]SPC10658.1 conserved hypothetical protein [Cupriavidus oxalaticus]